MIQEEERHCFLGLYYPGSVQMYAKNQVKGQEKSDPEVQIQKNQLEKIANDFENENSVRQLIVEEDDI